MVAGIWSTLQDVQARRAAAYAEWDGALRALLRDFEQRDAYEAVCKSVTAAFSAASRDLRAAAAADDAAHVAELQDLERRRFVATTAVHEAKITRFVRPGIRPDSLPGLDAAADETYRAQLRDLADEIAACDEAIYELVTSLMPDGDGDDE